jgi:CRP/FNR family transcriptional regulator
MPDPGTLQKIDSLGSIFQQLPQAVKSRLDQLLQTRQFKKGQRIYLQDAEPQAVYIVTQGQVKINRVTKTGYETILCIRGPGDIFCPVPILDHGSQLGTAIAVTDVELLWGPKDRFYHLCEEYPELLAVVQRDCLHEVRRLMERLEARAFLSVEERLAYALLEESKQRVRQGEPGKELRIMQEDLAALIGSSRESVSRSLGAFEKQGILSIYRGRLVLHDLGKLAQICRRQ